jgi:hypothetical protein
MGRVGNYVKKIEYFETEFKRLLLDNKRYLERLQTLHAEVYFQDANLQNLEQDLDKTSKLLIAYQRMLKLWKESNQILDKAVSERIRIQTYHDYMLKVSLAALDRVNTIHAKLHEQLQRKIAIEPKVSIFEITLVSQQEKLKTQISVLKQTTTSTRMVEYCQPGNAVLLKYGFGTVISYRVKDDMCLVLLEFGFPRAKCWVTGTEIFRVEQLRQNKECDRMKEEERKIRHFVTKERRLEKDESAKMLKEDLSLKVVFT